MIRAAGMRTQRPAQLRLAHQFPGLGQHDRLHRRGAAVVVCILPHPRPRVGQHLLTHSLLLRSVTRDKPIFQAARHRVAFPPVCEPVQAPVDRPRGPLQVPSVRQAVQLRPGDCPVPDRPGHVVPVGGQLPRIVHKIRSRRHQPPPMSPRREVRVVRPPGDHDRPPALEPRPVPRPRVP